jgi:putative membrane protein
MATTPATNDLPAATKLAVERTRLAHERTLMAWVRTGTSLISFGFTIYKFFEYLRAQQQVAPRATLIGPREFALIMIGIGVGALVLATIGHLRNMRALRAEYGELIPYSLSTLVAASIGFVGVLLFFLALFRQ